MIVILNSFQDPRLFRYFRLMEETQGMLKQVQHDSL